jgi:hypothetical protein
MGCRYLHLGVKIAIFNVMCVEISQISSKLSFEVQMQFVAFFLRIKIMNSFAVIFILAFFIAIAASDEGAGLQTYKIGANSTSAAKKYFKSGFVRSNSDSVEKMLLYREFELFKQVSAEAKAKGASIRGFYHTSTWQPKWATVILEQLRLLDGQRQVLSTEQTITDTTKASPIYHWDTMQHWASLLDASDGLFLNVAGPSKDDALKVKQLVDRAGLKHRNKITINFNKTVDRDAFNSATPEGRKNLFAQSELSSGEHATIDALHNYCEAKVAQGDKNAIVYYLHSKW